VISQARRSKFLAGASAFGRFIENTLLSFLLAGMIGLGALQIGLRWSDLGSLVWGDEAIRLMVLWIAMIAGVAAAREDRHISIDVLSRFLGARSKAIAAVVVDLFTSAVCLALAWYGWGMLRFAMEDGDVFFGDLPAWVFQSIIPAAFALMSYRYFLWFVRGLRTLLGGDPK
jgi:TRAP-type C4-dicarboxylate transport system permease small subunit